MYFKSATSVSLEQKKYKFLENYMAKDLLTKRQLASLKKDDWLSDGSGLALKGSASGFGSWVYRKRVGGKLKSTGLGPYPNVSVEAARAKRDEIEQSIRGGQSFEGAVFSAKTSITHHGPITFWQYADDWLRRNKPIPVSGKPRTNTLWRKRIEDYCSALHPIPMDEICVTHIRDTLMPIWMDRIESANRTRHHLGAIFASARVEGIVENNPAAWADNLVHIMPKRRKKVQHHASLLYQEIPHFYCWLEQQNTITARCIQWAILTGVRPSEARWTEWSEFDFDSSIWNVPESRMKDTGVSTRHIVPLSTEMVRILVEMRKKAPQQTELSQSDKTDAPWRIAQQGQRANGLLFCLRDKCKPVSDTSLRKMLLKAPFDHCTMHGFRATFRTWLEEEMDVPERVAEACLAHKEPDMKKRAYLRTDHFKQRVPLMERWGQYLASDRTSEHPVFGSVPELSDPISLAPQAKPVGRLRQANNAGDAKVISIGGCHV